MKSFDMKVLTQNIKGAVFDLDGTILDSLAAWRTIDDCFFEKRKIAYDYNELFNDTMGMSFRLKAEHVRQKYGVADSVDEIYGEWFAHYYSLLSTAAVDFFPGVIAFFEGLRSQGVQVGIATANTLAVWTAMLGKYPQLKDLVHNVTTCEEVGKDKPDPAVYFRSMEKMGLRFDQCIVFEDSLTGLKGAKQTKSLTVCVLSDSYQREEKLSLASFVLRSYVGLV